VLRRHYPLWGRQAVQRLIAGRGVHINGRPVWLASWQVHKGDRISITAAPAAKPPPHVTWDERWLIFSDDQVVAVDKPAGLLTEPPSRREAPNLHALAQARFGPLILVHRLDRDTSGVVVLARTAKANRDLSAAFQAHKLEKEYVAIVAAPNLLEATGTIRFRLAPDPQRRERVVVVTKGGQGAVTRYIASARQPDRQLIRLWPETGRTHQLRVHLAAMQAPILGDRLYGNPDAAPRLLLHAYRLGLPGLLLTAPLPGEFAWPGIEL
jgi:23S rRNA pseudouridine1911/1915/1917 synthase